MIPSVTNLIPLPAASPAETAVTGTTETSTEGEFQSILSDASRETLQTSQIGLPDNQLDESPEVPESVASVAGVFAFAAQLLVQVPNDAVPNDATATNSLLATASGQPTLPRAEALFQQQTGGLTPATLPTASTADGDTISPAPNEIAVAGIANAELTASQIPATPVVIQPQLGLTRSVADVQPAQRQVVVQQTPLVAGVLPNLPTTGSASGTPTPITETLPAIGAAALPDISVGNRPTTAGEQFAAIASAAIPLAEEPTVAPTDTAFRNVLAEVAEPIPVAATPVALPSATPVALPSSTPAVPITGSASAVSVTDREFLQNVVESLNVTNAAIVSQASVDVPLQTVGLQNSPEEFASLLPQPLSINTFETAPSLDVDVIDEDSQLQSASAALPREASFTVAGSDRVPSQTPVPVSTPTPAVQITERIAAVLRTGEQPGTTEFQMRLDPPELGSIRIRLVSVGDQMRGTVVVADDAVRRMIESQLPELRHRLEEVGIHLQQFDVSTDSSSSNSGNGYRPEFANEFFPRIPVRGNPQPPRAVGSRESSTLDVTV